MTAQQLINKAAERHYQDAKEDYLRDDAEYLHRDFIAGANYALSTPELWREQWMKFLEWVGNGYWRYSEHSKKWFVEYSDNVVENEYTTDELFDIYIQTLKEK